MIKIMRSSMKVDKSDYITFEQKKKKTTQLVMLVVAVRIITMYNKRLQAPSRFVCVC